ncbi:tetratricopeptide repeat-containing sensor histidine kinase [Paraflavitalea pollutisoli]|uniref:tetratricopeptide repeat-containing sensor histidine kinase n=1 Tax=Paraflavitalea pollutisoli TaxID=3034143 RepID=UPI0023ECBB90|nr:sensor histidine kinase [Paraflavitalea sp. H1-2-19X]
MNHTNASSCYPYYLLSCLLTLIICTCQAQTISDIHARYKPLVTRVREDTNLVRQLLQYGDALMDYDNDTALPVIQRAANLSERLQDGYGKAKSAALTGIIYSDKAELSEAKAWFDKAIIQFTAIGNHLELGKVYNNVGNLCYYQDDFETAITWYLKAAAAMEQAGARRFLAQVYDGIGNTFNEVNEFNKSIQYLDKAEALAREQKDTALLCRILNNRSVTLISLGKEREAVNQYLEVLTMADKGINLVTRFMVRSNLANSYTNFKQLDSAMYYIRQAESLALRSNTPYYVMNVYLCYSKIYEQSNQWEKAKDYMFKAKAIATKMGSKEGLWKVYGNLVRVYAHLGKSMKSLDAFDQFREYNDSLLSEKMHARVNELETKYRTLQKDKVISDKQLSIEQQKASLRRKDLMIMITIIAMITLLLIGILIWLGVRQKQKLQWLMIQKEHELLAVKAMMEGEERERTRIARNLHDGVGSILSAARLNMDSLGHQVVQLPAIPAYKESMTLLKDATAEIRETAHNLLPVTLHEQGLVEAVKTFCQKVNGNRLDVNFHAYGEPGRYNSHFELMVYRTIQELINNVIRHADASAAVVQLTFTEDMLSITVEDNGSGFDPDSLANSQGLGIYSLHTRMQAFQGKVDIDSSSQGTSIHVEFNTDKLRYVA